MSDLRDNMLAEAKSKKTMMDLFLKNGIRLSGRILDFDEESVLISSPKVEPGILIERSATATYQPSAPKGERNDRNERN